MIDDAPPLPPMTEEQKEAWKAGIKSVIKRTPYPTEPEEDYTRDQVQKDLQRRVTWWRDVAVGWYNQASDSDWHEVGTNYISTCARMGDLALKLSESFRRDAEEAV